MKLDSEQVLYQAQKLDYKPFACNDNALESVARKSVNGTMKENHDGVLCNLEGGRGDSEQLKSPPNDKGSWDAQEHDCSMTTDNINHNNAEEVMDYGLPNSRAHASSKMRSCDSGSVLFMDKSVMEHKLPELIICYKEEVCSVIKDICVDEGVPSQDKSLVKGCVGENNTNPFLPHESGVKEEITNNGFESNALKSPAEAERVNAHLLMNPFLPDESGTPVEIINKERVDVLLLTNPFLPYESGMKEEIINNGVVSDALKSPAETERVGVPLLTSDVLKLYDEKDFKNDLCVESDSKSLVPNKEAKDEIINKILEDGPKEIMSLGELLSMPDSGLEVSSQRSSGGRIKEAEQLSLLNTGTSTVGMDTAGEEAENDGEGTTMRRSILVPGAAQHHGNDKTVLETSFNLSSEAEKPDHSSGDINFSTKQSDGYQEGQVLANPTTSTCEESGNGSKEEKSSGPALCFLAEESTSAVSDELSNNEESETANSHLDTDISTLAVNDKEDSTKHVDSESIESRNSTSNEDANTVPISRQFHQYGPGESSFSAAAPPVTGLISYSGPVAYSGSVSMRSESSTTSTHSFAFPVLQSEWNSSPVRMAKADRRPKGWRHTLLCCRF